MVLEKKKKMIKVVTICFSLLLFLSCADQQRKKETLSVEPETTYYLIRHAEKDRSDTTNTNPSLTERGLERAKLWATYFDSIPLDKIYSTNYLRTQQTAKYTAEQKKLPIENYEPTTLITEDFIKEHEGKRVLIVGHSNTTPMLVNTFMGNGKFEDIPDSINSRLYIVEITKGKKCASFTEVELK